MLKNNFFNAHAFASEATMMPNKLAFHHQYQEVSLLFTSNFSHYWKSLLSKPRICKWKDDFDSFRADHWNRFTCGKPQVINTLSGKW